MLALARTPADSGLLADLAGDMRTLKARCAQFPELGAALQLIRTAEDVLQGLREDGLPFDTALADLLFSNLDLIGRMLELADHREAPDEVLQAEAEHVVTELRELLARRYADEQLARPASGPLSAAPPSLPAVSTTPPSWFAMLPADLRTEVQVHSRHPSAEGLTAICYTPHAGCFFKGEDPLLLARRTPGLNGLIKETIDPWPGGSGFDPYRSNLRFLLLSQAGQQPLREYFSRVADQIEMYVPAAIPQGAGDGGGTGTGAGAKARVRLVRSAQQLFGVPQEQVIDTAHVPLTATHTIRQQRAAILRDRIVPLYSLNRLLDVPANQRLDEDGNLAVLVLRTREQDFGVVVDDFEAEADLSIVPVEGALAGIQAYAGTAQLADGTLVVILNMKELL